MGNGGVKEEPDDYTEQAPAGAAAQRFEHQNHDDSAQDQDFRRPVRNVLQQIVPSHSGPEGRPETERAERKVNKREFRVRLAVPVEGIERERQREAQNRREELLLIERGAEIIGNVHRPAEAEQSDSGAEHKDQSLVDRVGWNANQLAFPLRESLLRRSYIFSFYVLSAWQAISRQGDGLSVTG